MFRPFETAQTSFSSTQLCITDFGAKPNAYDVETSRTNAKAIQAAIDKASSIGGAHVVVPSGFFATSPIQLKSNVDLHLEHGAVLKFTKSKEDYPIFVTNYEGEKAIRTISPITADGAENIAITGNGIIDGSGDLWRPIKRFKLTEKQWDALLAKGGHIIQARDLAWIESDSAYEGLLLNIQGTDEKTLAKAAPYWDFYRPVMVSLRHCKRVLLQGVTFSNSPAWNIHPFFCEDLTVDGITVKNPYHAQNGDGIDVESCKRVEIKASTFETGDDAICIKSGKNAEARTFEGPSCDIHVHDCTVYQGHGGFVVGSEMSRGVFNILVERCSFIGTDVGVRFKSALGRGGVVKDIDIRDITMVDIKGESIILTMAYVLNRINNDELPQMDNEEDIPFFCDIDMQNMHFLGQKTKLLIQPITGRADTISNIVVNGVRYDGENKIV
ncbi:MAG: glycoside hydrolase family 28 protein [Sphaerochaetaceae bacterium]|nr:glycoside hydrolase family 28 protein [Sphaerochaetaceae bacterium]